MGPWADRISCPVGLDFDDNYDLAYQYWLRSTVGGTPVFGRRTDPVLHLTFS